MRNLKLAKSTAIHLPELSNSQHISVDYDTGILYAGTRHGVIGFDPRTRQLTGSTSLVEAGYLPADGKGKIVGLQHLPDQMSVCVATYEGDVIIWNTVSVELECVGSVESGLRWMSWSPDQELVVLSTGNNTLIMMTKDFDPLTEVPMNPEGFGEDQFITVGWGKKETQFHGSAGKAAAVLKKEALTPALPWDDGMPCISWRGDGQFFVVSSISPDTGARKLRVWSRDCVLQSTSENLDGLEHTLSWRPSGNLIASVQRKPNKYDVVLFEKNGLKHGEFTMPFQRDEVLITELQWNNDSTVLAVVCEKLNNGAEEESSRSYVQLWTVNNYHWYLKQTLIWDKSQFDKATSILWDPEHALTLHIVSSEGNYMQYTWSFATDCSLGGSENDQANVAVIDGSRVLITPFRSMVVPPPMCAYHIQLPEPVDQVVFAQHPHSERMAILMADGRIAIYNFSKEDQDSFRNKSAITHDASVKIQAGGNGFQMPCVPPRLSGIFSAQVEESSNQSNHPLGISHLVWVNPTCILFVMPSNSGNSSLCQAELIENADNKTYTVRETFELEEKVICMCNCPSAHVAIQLASGSLLKYQHDSGLVLPWESLDGHEVHFPQPCMQMAVCTIGEEEVVIGLTERYRCYVNEMEVASNCTSFAIHESFLLLTTLSHTLRCISRSIRIKDLPSLSDGKAHPFDESIRRIERGSRIVTVVPDDTKLILQMPRGNLETIHPRALLLSAIRKYLDRLEFKLAIELMMKHRINMNLIYDHNPEVFLENVKKFIQLVDSPTHINLFLADLQEEDVTITMYPGIYGRVKPMEDDDSKPVKVDRVCDAVRTALEQLNADKYFLCILTTHVKKRVPELDLALQKIKDLKGNNPVGMNESLRHLLYLVDVNELYDVALGTYDFHLVLMVAEKSQKDPKEYLPFLNHLQSLESNYQKFTIDNHLKRYSSALGHIAKCGPSHFSECLTLVKDHSLYAQALQLFDKTTQEYMEIASAYGTHLSDKKQYEDAGLMYSKAGDHEKALNAFVKALSWRMALIMAAKLQYEETKMNDLSRMLVTELKNAGRFTEAACILEQYIKDIEEAVVVLIEGCQWEEALRLMHKWKRTDFIESNLKAALLEKCEQQLNFIEDTQEVFQKHKTRLVIVRKEKERQRLELLEGCGTYNDADADLFSDASSATGESIQSSKYTTSSQRSSVASRTSGKSSKNRRKTERKKWSLKEGSAHEDLALVEALSNYITCTEQMKDEIKSLLHMLVMFDYEDQASKLQKNFDQLLQLIERSIPTIWDGSMEGTNQTSQLITGPDATVNSILQSMQQERQPRDEPQLGSHLRIPPTINKNKNWKTCI
ncbi:elongator complex protein 1 [Lingula anatina]|uniref:Elongator complex protein 1 n=1 Tax=Lingula anatina TaxID=7574 RepID=A0A1S3H0H9_LINAN|nr:elongator complex protein 1 [Lingula anatina]XP_023933355.1 elongator complex protein 1 [Lingula anatina]XP_023933356.1 elongator complex protein 1 [Lingula anatina]|eukprot:XP_013379508.1 elongator complex protein 1 [Lingula anatina]